MKEIFKKAIEKLHKSEDINLSLNGSYLSAEGSYEPLLEVFSSLSTGKDSEQLATHIHFEGEKGGKGAGSVDLTQEGRKLAYAAIGLNL